MKRKMFLVYSFSSTKIRIYMCKSKMILYPITLVYFKKINFTLKGKILIAKKPVSEKIDCYL